MTPDHKSTQTQDVISDSAARQCKCNEEGILSTVKKESINSGRKYWTCRRAGCGFFEWDDEPPRTASQGVASRAESSNTRSGPGPGSECFKVWIPRLLLLHVVMTTL